MRFLNRGVEHGEVQALRIGQAVVIHTDLCKVIVENEFHGVVLTITRSNQAQSIPVYDGHGEWLCDIKVPES